MPVIDTFPLLLAADMWQVVIGIIVFILYSIGQLVTAREQAKKKPAQPRQPRRPQDLEAQVPARQNLERLGRAKEMPAPGQGNQEEALRQEVEDFLRRAQGKPPRQEQPKPQLSKRSRRVPVAEQAESSRRPQAAELAINLRQEGVAEHVASHLSSRQMIEHAEHLGDDVGLADERLESRLHDKFDHDLGSLKREKKPTAPQEKELSLGEEVVALLRKPGGMKQIVVAQEILRRPEW